MQGAQTATEGQWFYEEKGERKGRLETQQIITLIQSGKLIYGCLVWKKGMPDWVQIEKTGLRQQLEALAFAPIIGFLLESVVAGLMGNSGSKRAVTMGEIRKLFSRCSTETEINGVLQ